VDIKQLSEFCKTAIPFLGMTLTALQIYFDAPKEVLKDRWVYVKHGFTFIFFAVLACLRVWS
jgi:hypothetical protein